MAEKNSLTREQYLESIRQLSAAANDLASRYILECLDHLAISTEGYLDAMGAAIGDARPGSGKAAVFHVAGLPSAWFTQSLEPPPRTKIRAPGKIRPRPTLNPEGILPQFQKAMDRVSALVASSSGKDLNSIRFRNPFIPLLRFTVASGFLIIAAHGRRHLWQAEQVAKEPDFP